MEKEKVDLELLKKARSIRTFLEDHGVKIEKGGLTEYKCCCPLPGHNDTNASFYINNEKNVFHCKGCGKSGSIIDLVVSLKGCSFRDAVDILSGQSKQEVQVKKVPAAKKNTAPPKLTNTFVYRSETGKPVFFVKRFVEQDGSKTFRQGYINDKGVEILSMKDVQRVPYNLDKFGRDGTVWLCYSPDTELLTDKGWIRFDKIDRSEKVAQWNPNCGEISFATPSAWQIIPYSGDLVRIKTRFSDLLVTPNHRQPIFDSAGNLSVVRADAVKQRDSLPVSGVMRGGSDSLSESIVRLLVAFAADGNVCKKSPTGGRDGIRWGFSKQRKIERIKMLLDKCGFDYDVYKCARGDTLVVTKEDALRLALSIMPEKRWTHEMVGWSLPNRIAAVDELAYWDGTKYGDSIKFDTVRKDEADAVCAVACVSGYRSGYSYEDRDGKSRIYRVSLSKASARMISAVGPRGRRVKWSNEKIPYVGNVYCCTVPTSHLVTRRNGKVVISGNCEGEKCAEALCSIGLIGTCTAGGSGGWLDAYAAYFVDRDVMILPDYDEPGEKYASAALESIKHVARSVRVVRVGRPGMKKGYDVADCIKEIREDTAASTDGRSDGTEEARAFVQSLANAATQIVKGVELNILSMNSLIERHKEATKSSSLKRLSIAKHLPSLEGIVRDFRTGDCVFIKGPTGSAKTMFAQSIARWAAPQKVLVFEIELAPEDLAARWVAMENDVEIADVADMHKGGDICVDGINHIYTCHCSNPTPQYIEQTIRNAELIIGEKPGVVIVDYIQLVRWPEKCSRYERFSNIAEYFRTLPNITRTIMIVVSQVARPDSSMKGERVPSRYDSKESGSIETSATLMLDISPGGSPSIKKITVMKDTHSSNEGKSAEVGFIGEKAMFGEPVKMSSEIF